MTGIIVRVVICLQALCWLPGFAFAASSFPERPVHIIVPYSPGGGADGLARPLANKLSQMWKQTVIVENKAGASTILGAAYVARSAKDGYTLLLTNDSTITGNPFLFKQLPYNPMKDFAPITQLVDLHHFVLLQPSVPVKSMQELVAYAKENPNKLTYGSYGRGSPPELFFGALKEKTGASVLEVPFNGSAPAILAVLQGVVQSTLAGPPMTGQYVKAGKMKALAVMSAKRLKDFPNVPTLAETGFGYADPKPWFGLFAPAGTPAEIVVKIRNAVAAILKKPDFRQRYIEAVDYTAVGSTTTDFAAFIKRDFEQKRKMIAAAGIRKK